MNLLISSNDKYIKYTIVLLKSIYVNNPNICIDLYLLHNGLTEKSKKMLEDFVTENNQQVFFLKCDNHFFENLQTTATWSVETYFRLLCHTVLPQDMERILYLDVDIIVDDYIYDFYNTDFEGKCLIACPGVPSGWATAFDDIYAARGWYFNAGVLIFNLDYFRRNVTVETYLAAYNTGLNFMADQGLLNYLFCRNTKYLSPLDWNYRYNIALQFNKEAKQTAYKRAIIHYTCFYNPYKPWDLYFEDDEIEKACQGEFAPENFYVGRDLNELNGIWWKYAKMTSIYEELYGAMQNKKDFYFRCILDFLKKQHNPVVEYKNRLKESSKAEIDTLKSTVENLNTQLQVANLWQKKDKIKVSVLGSCYSRACMMSNDFFNPDYKKYVDLGLIFYHSSYISLTSDKIDLDVSNMKTKNTLWQPDFDTWAEMEFKKNFLDTLKTYQPEYLIVDNYADANHDVIKVNENKYFTLNYFLNDADILSHFPDGEFIRLCTESRWHLTINKMFTFWELLNEIIPDERIILVRGKLNEYRLSDTNKKIYYDGLDYIRKKNVLWEKLDEALLKKHPNIKVIDMRNTNYVGADKYHPMGIRPSHYQSGWYKELWIKLNEIFISDI